MNRHPVLSTRTVEAQDVHPRDVVAVRGDAVVSVSHIEEFYVNIRFQFQPPMRMWKGANVTVDRVVP